MFALVGLGLAAFGLYAVVAYAVSQRRQEIGIRMAVGAEHRDIVSLFARQGVAATAAGLMLGLVASLAVNRLLQSELVGVSPTDPLTYVLVSAILILFAALGCFIPARRAARVDPLVVLRHE
jgi:putative ABC transport system permease protein